MNKTLTKFHEKNLAKMCRKRGVDPTTIDFEALWDSTLTNQENYDVLTKKIQALSTQKTMKEKKEIIKKMEEYQEQAQNEETERLEEMTDSAIEEIKDSSTVELDKYYEELSAFIDVLLVDDNAFALFVKGTCGIGKSFNTIRKLKLHETKFSYLSGNITPLELFHKLYENKEENKVLVLDDTLALMQSKPCMALLYEACWSPSGVRSVEWNSTSSKLKVPKKFVYEGKIIFLLNEPPRNNMMINTLIDRCLTYELDFSYKERFKLLAELSKIRTNQLTKKQNFEIVDWLRQRTTSSKKEAVSLRTFVKLQGLRKAHPSKWKRLGKELWELKE